MLAVLPPAPPDDVNGWSVLLEHDQAIRRVQIPKQLTDLLANGDPPDWNVVTNHGATIHEFVESEDVRHVRQVYADVLMRPSLVELSCASAECPGPSLVRLHEIISLSLLDEALQSNWDSTLSGLNSLVAYDRRLRYGSMSYVRALLALAGSLQTERVVSIVLDRLDRTNCDAHFTSDRHALDELHQEFMSGIDNQAILQAIEHNYLVFQSALSSGCRTVEEVSKGQVCQQALPRMLYDSRELIAANNRYYAALLDYAAGTGPSPVRINMKERRFWWMWNVLGRRLLTALAPDDRPFVAKFIAGRTEWAMAAGKLAARLERQINACFK